MKTVKVIQVTIKKFRSIRNQVIVFPQTEGLRFLGGKNLEEPELGANGCGKSSLWEAVHWILFGVSSKGTKVSNLISWGEEECEGELILEINRIQYNIKRAGPPVKLYINNELQEQYVLDNLTGLTKTRFQNSIIFSQGQRLFPDLTIPERGELLEDVLNLQFWSRCSDTVGSKIKAIENELTTAKQAVTFSEGRLAGLLTEYSIKIKQEEWEKQKKETIKHLKSELGIWEAQKIKEITSLEVKKLEFEDGRKTRLSSLLQEEVIWKGVKRTEVTLKVDKLEELEKTFGGLTISGDIAKTRNLLHNTKTLQSKNNVTIATSLNRLETIDKEVHFWEITTSCSACNQPITDTHKTTRLVTLRNEKQIGENFYEAHKKQQSDLDIEEEKLSRELEVLLQKEGERKHLEKQTGELEFEIKLLVDGLDNSPYGKQKLSIENQANPFIEQIEESKTRINPYPPMLEKEKQLVNPFIEELKKNIEARTTLTITLEKEKLEVNNLLTRLLCIEYWKNGFKKLRVFLMHKVLQSLEIEVNSAATTLGLKNWKIALKSETETKSGTIKIGIQIQIIAPSSNTPVPWECWSGGEAQRLKLALTEGVASLIQRAAGSWWNLEVWDEPTSSLSAEGVEDLMEALDYRSQVTNKSLWIVDHSALTYSNFTSIWTAVKEKETGTVFQV